MIAIIDYGAGNLTSVRLAFETLGVPAEVTDSAQRVRAADRIVFPGVGAAGAAMQGLRESNLDGAIRDVVGDGVPFLGICVGTQILFDSSEENGGVDGLGIVPGRVRLFRPAEPYVKVPQIGWNQVTMNVTHPVFEGVPSDSDFYFVHSYYPEAADTTHVLGQTTYAGVTFSSVVGRDNLVATQFHTEKSGRIGLLVLENFSKWNGEWPR